MKDEGTLSLREDDEDLPQTEMLLSRLGGSAPLDFPWALPFSCHANQDEDLIWTSVIWHNSVLDKSFAFRPKDSPKHRRA
jgi:hypothetical protein